MPTYYTPEGKPEVWADGSAPSGYKTEDEYFTANPHLSAPTPFSVRDGDSWSIDTDRAAEAVRVERDRRVEATRWRFERYESEMRQGLEPSDDINQLDVYVQALRDLTLAQGFPWAGPLDSDVPWPVEP
nr:phage tail assembly chaperone [Pseudodesulfovibrio sp.]